MTIKDLNPALVWNIFDQITKVPRPSKKEEKIREYLVNFTKEHGIYYSSLNTERFLSEHGSNGNIKQQLTALASA